MSFSRFLLLLLRCRFSSFSVAMAVRGLFLASAIALAFSAILRCALSYDRPPPRDTLSVHLSNDLHSTSPQQVLKLISDTPLKFYVNGRFDYVHISLVGEEKMRISWITEEETPATIQYGTSTGVYDSSATGSTSRYSYLMYTSGEIHEVVIGPLKPDTVYYYRCGSELAQEYSFKTPPANLPIKFAIVGDLGQTGWTNSTLQHIAGSNYDVMLLPGDLSYADLYQPLWDSFGRLVEPLASQRPWMVTQGNHEIEKLPLLHPSSFSSYNTRWRMPFEDSASNSNLYYSFEVAGVHVVMLGSYTDFDAGSAQYKWLEADLGKVNRERTPWLVVLIHAPWYNSNTAHQGEHEAVDMKKAMEGLLYGARVDVVFAGHVHAYERFTRVYDGKANACAPVHITIGDGGNREGLASKYMDPQPDISVFREASFGHGQFEVVNASHAVWRWHRNDDDEPIVADTVWLKSLTSDTGGWFYFLCSLTYKSYSRFLLLLLCCYFSSFSVAMAVRGLFLASAIALAFSAILRCALSYDRPPPRDILSVHLSDDLLSTSPQQVHISLVGEEKMRISWITAEETPATVQYGTSTGVYGSSATGSTSRYSYLMYTSGEIHEVVIGPLKPDTVYYYRCGSELAQEYSFKTPPANLPIKFAIVGDLGQTGWTNSTLQHIAGSNYDVMLLPGDLSYADLYQPLWDSFGQLVEPLASKRPWMVTQGNHEIEKLPLLHPSSFSSYNSRWHMPFEDSASDSNLYYSFEVAGVHVVMLGSYTDFDTGSAQYKWLEADLGKVNRERTPWLVVLIHAPWYNSNTAHQGEHEAVDMKKAMEGLLYGARVDVVFAGHVHAYERFTRVYDGKANACGPVHITIGDGGNHNGLASKYMDPQPDISVFREASFGHGQFEVVNASHAVWGWHRNDDDEPIVADTVWLRSLTSDTAC
ncbi:hypothetical protein HHK36_016762 [Tetracentron sinense]|uniref:Purple acid phosphatase n=1 Tax=Tetracentron sinense TaxID=13715 RepID=A0A834Z6G3_TETSI|nr:hypothetical protein HHK36_016762 [Tetracentron sinense]